MTQHQGTPFLQAPKKIALVPMDSGGTRGLRRFEEVFDYPTHSSGPRAPQKLVSATSNMVSTAIVVEQGESDTNLKI
jgi:hypothetical protein